MRTLYCSDYCGDYGEAQAMFDDEGQLLDYWYTNDGNWRAEYFDSFLNRLGITVDYSGKYDEALEEILKVENE